MNKTVLEGKQHIHFIGIGGSGMYPLAQILHAKGFYLTGSDNNETDTQYEVIYMSATGIMVSFAFSPAGIDSPEGRTYPICVVLMV